MKESRLLPAVGMELAGRVGVREGNQWPSGKSEDKPGCAGTSVPNPWSVTATFPLSSLPGVCLSAKSNLELHLAGGPRKCSSP